MFHTIYIFHLSLATRHAHMYEYRNALPTFSDDLLRYTRTAVSKASSIEYSRRFLSFDNHLGSADGYEGEIGPVVPKNLV